MRELELTAALLRGDKKVFRRFYNQTNTRLYGWVLSRVKNHSDAEELVQDTYLSFLDSLPLFRGKSALKTFLYSIARHEIADYWRKKYAKKAIRMVPFMDQVYTEKLYSASLLNEEIERVYAKLRSDQAQVLRLKYEQGFSVGEIGKKLSLSAKAVESRLFRARKAFQVIYAEMYQE